MRSQNARTTFPRFLLAQLVTVAIADGSSADILINNGLAPPAPSNVFDSSNPLTDQLHVRNVGCPPGAEPNLWDPCPLPGAATEVGILDASSNFGWFHAYDSSTVTMSGGQVLFAGAHDDSTVEIAGGEVIYDLEARDSAQILVDGGSIGRDILAHQTVKVWMLAGQVLAIRPRDSSTVHLAGGRVLGNLYAYHSTTLTVYGGGFEVDGDPVPLGPLAAVTGTLTGTLASGDSLNNVFYQGGYSANITGSIILAPAAEPAPVPVAGRGALILFLLSCGVLGLRRKAVAPRGDRD